MKAIVAFASLSLLLVGCQSGPTLEGNWKGQMTQSGRTVDCTMTFKGGNYTRASKVGFSQIEATLTETGTFTYKDKVIHLTPVDVKATTDKTDMMSQKLIEAINGAQKSQALEMSKKYADWPIEFKGNEEFDVTAQGSSFIFKRA